MAHHHCRRGLLCRSAGVGGDLVAASEVPIHSVQRHPLQWVAKDTVVDHDQRVAGSEDHSRAERCVGREIGLRKAVYPKFVASKRLTQIKMDYEIAAMEAVYATLKALKLEREAKVP